MAGQNGPATRQVDRPHGLVADRERNALHWQPGRRARQTLLIEEKVGGGKSLLLQRRAARPSQRHGLALFGGWFEDKAVSDRLPRAIPRKALVFAFPDAAQQRQTFGPDTQRV